MANFSLDLAFALDCTSSMGSYINQAKTSIYDIANKIQSILTGQEIRFALIEYRDHPPQDTTFITNSHNFTSNVSIMEMWLNECSARGGGDGPEAVADAIFELNNLSWESDIKIAVLISDAPPHGLYENGDGFPNGCPLNIDPLFETNKLAMKGITLHIIGVEPSLQPFQEFFMALARMCGGLYLPLCNASSLPNAIINGAKEEISYQHILQLVREKVRRAKFKYGDLFRERIIANDLKYNSGLLKNEFQKSNTTTLQMQLENGKYPKPSGRIKRFARCTKLEIVKEKFIFGKTYNFGNPVFTLKDNPIDDSLVQRLVQKVVMTEGF